MATPAPLFEVNNIVYVRESAALGFLEAYRISSVLRASGDEWVYSINIIRRPGTPPLFGERISHQPEGVLYFNESELISKCEALELIEDHLTSRLSTIQQLRASEC